MPSKEELKQKACAEIDAKADKLINISQSILNNPEPGFREVKTSQLVASIFQEANIPYRDGLAITGVKAELRGGSDGPCVAILGELDSLIVAEHPYADSITGAAHACGHHAQIAMMLGATYGLMIPEVLSSLSGRIALIAVPAEEYIEIEYRNTLREQKRIEFLGGKPEFIRLQEFDNVDIAMMCHTISDQKEHKLSISSTNNGTLAKMIQFIGRGAHAGGAPHMGVNALNAASLALMAIHANRETFRDDDSIRVHPIITKGGEAVSAVPADVRMETFVRGKSINAIKDANTKVDRALRAGAMAVGAKVRITTIPGYLPIRQDQQLNDLYRANAASLVGEDKVGLTGHRTGSTDMGDLSHIMPVVHPYVSGATGVGHGKDYVIEDYSLAVITAAKALTTTVIDLLADGARIAGDVRSSHTPAMTRNEYLDFMRNQAKDELFDPAD